MAVGSVGSWASCGVEGMEDEDDDEGRGGWLATSKPPASDEGSEYSVGGEKARVDSASGGEEGEGCVAALVSLLLEEEDKAAAWAWACFCFCSARRAASWRRAREGGMLRGGGGGGPRGVEVLLLVKVSRARSEEEM